MRAVFLADAHLRSPGDDNYRLLLEFLDTQQGQLDGLFLLGDILEFWIGYRHTVFSAYLPLLERLHQLVESGCRLYYVEGNHDFRLGPYFSDTLNCRIITDAEVVDWDGQKLYLCHGDLINEKLWSYRLLRAFWRSRPAQLLQGLLPPDLVWRFGNWLCGDRSKYLPENRNFDPTPLVRPFAERQLAAGSDLFVCGHFHKPLCEELPQGQLTILGDWIHQYSYAELVDGRIELKSFAPQASSSS